MFPIKDDIPPRRFPILTLLIIVACTVVYFGVERGGWTLGTTGEDRVIEYGAVPWRSHPDQSCERVEQSLEYPGDAERQRRCG